MPNVEAFPADGGCTCGAVRYRLTAPPMFVHCCHCTWCQRQTGSAFVVNALIEASKLELLKGAVERTALATPSGRGQVVSRCPDCRIAVWSNYGRAGDRVHFVRVGTLDDPSAAPPDIHIHTATKLPWVTLPEGVPAMEEYYRPSDSWPAESLARYRAAVAV